ncbi:hypothetical protein AZE42_04306 [Rhizopogon vesiculosus]|uniref:Uncharacterized protein n=1 Tax=Rhizopogon vesiculosus TaxID=180088 RepID=A0A1J8QHZ1_9AGAM|nr:hypothetical protein AZE42_04306 [Rhizopogon vesiculosus]
MSVTTTQTFQHIPSSPTFTQHLLQRRNARRTVKRSATNLPQHVPEAPIWYHPSTVLYMLQHVLKPRVPLVIRKVPIKPENPASSHHHATPSLHMLPEFDEFLNEVEEFTSPESPLEVNIPSIGMCNRRIVRLMLAMRYIKPGNPASSHHHATPSVDMLAKLQEFDEFLTDVQDFTFPESDSEVVNIPSVGICNRRLVRLVLSIRFLLYVKIYFQ